MSKNATVALALAAVAVVVGVLLFKRRSATAAPIQSAPPPVKLSPAATVASAFQNFLGAASNYGAQYAIDRLFPPPPANRVETAPPPLATKPPSVTNASPNQQLVTRPLYMA